MPEPKALSQLLGPPQGERAEEPPCSAKMTVEDAYVVHHIKVYSKYRLIYGWTGAAASQKFDSHPARIMRRDRAGKGRDGAR